MRSLPRPNNNNSRRNLSYAALTLVALTAFAGSVFAAEATAESTAASGGTPSADAAASASAKVAATAAVMEAEGRELDRADAGLDASKAAAAVDPDHLLSHAEMDAMMRDAGFSLNRDTGLYDPPAGADKSQLSRQVLLPESGIDHAAFANVLLDQQHKFIQVEHGEFSLPAGEFWSFWRGGWFLRVSFLSFFSTSRAGPREEREEEEKHLRSCSRSRKAGRSFQHLVLRLLIALAARERGGGMREENSLEKINSLSFFLKKQKLLLSPSSGVTFLVKEYQQLLADALAITGISQPAVELDWLTQHVQYKIQEFNTLLVRRSGFYNSFFPFGQRRGNERKLLRSAAASLEGEE